MNIKDAVAKIKQDYNIVDFFREHNVNLKNTGPSTYTGLCPFHSEKTPSFKVSEDFQNYKCFGCGESGDIFSFAQHVHALDFVGAVKYLAAELNIELEEQSDGPSVDMHSVYNAISEAQKFFNYQYRQLEPTHAAKREIAKRGLNVDSEIYGYSLDAPNDLYKYLSAKGYSDEIIKETELVLFNEGRDPWDFFHGRLMITLSDYMGRPVSFTSRKLFDSDRMPGKYVNGRDSVVFNKKNNLFGIHLAKRSAAEKKEIIVVEGQFDQIALYEKGIHNVVATSGTAFTQEHANSLKRLVGNEGRIVFVFDGDSAGIKAAIGVHKNFTSIHTISYAVILDKGKDPGDYIQEGRLDDLVNKVNKSQLLSNFVVDRAFESTGSGKTLESRNKFVTTAVKLAGYADDSLVVTNILNRISILSAIPINTVKSHYETADKPYKYTPQKVEEKPVVVQQKLSEADKCMIAAFSLLVRAPDDLMKLTPSDIPVKFLPFLKEFNEKVKSSKVKQEQWRFIAESYKNERLAKAIYNHEFLGDPRANAKLMVKQYQVLIKQALQLYKIEEKQQRKANSMTAMVDMTDTSDIAEAIELIQK